MSYVTNIFYGNSAINTFVLQDLPYAVYVPEDFSPTIYTQSQIVSISGAFVVYSDVNDYEPSWWIDNVLYIESEDTVIRHATILSYVPTYYEYLGEENPYEPQYWYEVDFLDSNILVTGLIPAEFIHPFYAPPGSPVAASSACNVTQGNNLNIVLSSYQQDGNPLTYTVLTDTLYHGRLSGTAPNLTYVLSADHYGQDYFYFYTNDNQHYSNPARIDITINNGTIVYVLSAINRSNWTITTDSARAGYPITNVKDGSQSTIYSSDWTRIPLFPVNITVDMGVNRELTKIKVLPRQDQYSPSGNLQNYLLYTSLDGASWSYATSGTGILSRTETVITIPRTTARYFRINAQKPDNADNIVIAEINAEESIPQNDTSTPPVTGTGGGPLGTVTLKSSITKDDITWSFNQPLSCGQYCNGDWFVVGPATITNITPICQTITETLNSGSTVQRVINGTMVNPAPKTQGWDNAVSQTGTANIFAPYSSNLNVAPSKTGSPLVCPPGTSVVSSISKSGLPKTSSYTQIERLSILTVVGSIPLSGSFRPPPSGTDKTSYWTKDQLNYSVLRNLTPVSDTPSLNSLETTFEIPWTALHPGTPVQSMSPAQMPNYGREQATLVGDAILSLHLNYTNAQKEKLLISLVQYGIDIYGTLAAGASYFDGGGLDAGRKAPLVLAAVALNNATLKQYADAAQIFKFAEDRQTFIVSQSDIYPARGHPPHIYGGTRVLNDYERSNIEDIPHMSATCNNYSTSYADARRREVYTSSHLGLPEWGEQHTSDRNRDGSNWNVLYRHTNAPLVGNVFAVALLSGGRTTWNWEPSFEYYLNRFWPIESANGFYGQAIGHPSYINPFAYNMLTTYISLV